MLLHVLSVLGFLLAHGSSDAVMLQVRRESNRARLQALLDLSKSVAGAVAVTALLLFLSGIAAGFSGGSWGRGGFGPRWGSSLFRLRGHDMASSAVSIAGNRTASMVGRHAWKVLLAISTILGLFGLQDMFGGAANYQYGETVLMHSLTGMSWDELRAASPGAANLVNWLSRTGGAALFTIAILSAAICLTGFRRQQRWAWYTLWVMPFWMMFTAVSILAARAYLANVTPVPVISGSILTALWAGTLGLASRRFFGERR